MISGQRRIRLSFVIVFERKRGSEWLLCDVKDPLYESVEANPTTNTLTLDSELALTKDDGNFSPYH